MSRRRSGQVPLRYNYVVIFRRFFLELSAKFLAVSLQPVVDTRMPHTVPIFLRFKSFPSTWFAYGCLLPPVASPDYFCFIVFFPGFLVLADFVFWSISHPPIVLKLSATSPKRLLPHLLSPLAHTPPPEFLQQTKASCLQIPTGRKKGALREEINRRAL